MMKVALFVAVLVGHAQAQQVWNGLQFGMKIAEVQAAVKDAKPVESDPDVRVLEAPVTVRDHAGTARLIFSKDALVRIGLVFERARGKSCSSITTDEVVQADRLRQDLLDALREKYGRPVSADRRSTLWKDGGQTVRYSSMSACAGSVTVTVMYEPAGKDNI
jgi:hypothetical protein